MKICAVESTLILEVHTNFYPYLKYTYYTIYLKICYVRSIYNYVVVS